jgi:acetolactate synthase I/II/III large subunit
MNQGETVADYFAKFIAEKNVSTVFELSGGMIAFLSDAIYRYDKTRLINTRHEQTAGFAAEAASRVTGIPNVAMGTSGPGATNLITAIASAYFDSTPTLFVTGQVHSKELRQNPNQRQNGFQELNIVESTKGFTKFAYQVTSAEEFPSVLEKAWQIAIEGRPGPVLIDIPIDIQQHKCISVEIGQNAKDRNVSLDQELTGKFFERLASSKRPLILAGGGIRSSDSYGQFLEFVRATNIPVVQTLMGKDLLPTADPLNLGFIGSYGNRWANRALSKADFLLVLGSRLDVRQTGNDVSDFTANKFIVRVDVDPNELSGRVLADLNFEIDLKDFFANIPTKEFPKIDCSDVIEETSAVRSKFTSESEQEIDLALSPDKCIKWISRIGSTSAGYCVDVGQHQMWAAQSIELNEHQRFLTSGGMGAMGFSIPAAIGATTASNLRWITITGDGCMQLSSSELQTIAQYNLPVTIFVLNNKQHGMVAQFQEENMDSRYVSTRIGYSTPDFCELANAYGIDSYKIVKESDFVSVESALLANPNRPSVVEIEIDNRAKALPKIDGSTKLSQL